MEKKRKRQYNNMGVKEINIKLNDFFKDFNKKINQMPMDEKAAWGCIIFGIILVIVAILIW
ncbi:MAG: hypothetical protein QW331_00615 [Candidatus Woesearchaeota archaeon]